MADSIIINKAGSIERCLKRIREDYIGFESDFEANYMRQDAVLLNLQRACEQSIDLANHLVKILKIGVPQSSKSSFEILVENKIIDADLGQKLMRMVGFRNIAIHQYSDLDLKVVKSIIEKHLPDFQAFVGIALKFV